MNLESLVNKVSQQFLIKMQEFYEKEDSEALTFESASQMTEQIKYLVLAIAKKTMKTFLEGDSCKSKKQEDRCHKRIQLFQKAQKIDELYHARTHN